jgi:polyhydroxyalkanoate synthesis regulator phasin
MATTRSKWLALLGSALIGMTSAAFAQDSGPLLDLLVKKGVINDQEAENLRAELTKDFAANSSAGKLNLSSPLTELRITGDVRARYEERMGQVTNASGAADSQQRDRMRYRFRAGLTGKLLNDWSFGFRLETATGSRSSNVTMGDDATASTSPFAKTNDGVYVGQIWAGWTPNSNVNVIVGRMPNPLVSTLMVWDGDINPEGFAEQLKFRTGNIEYSANLAQFLYATNGNQRQYGTTANTYDNWMFAWQTGVKYYIEGATNFVQVNPTLYSYYHTNKLAETNAPFKNFYAAGNNTGINDLLVFDVPFEYDWVMRGTPMRAFGDVAINLEGDDRAKHYSATASSDSTAYQLGVQYGKAVNKGEWDFRVAWQSTGAFALDNNLVDSDLFDSRTNMEGVFISGNYALGAATQLTLTYADSKRKNDQLPALGSGDVGTNNNLDKYRLFQADLNVKF